LNVEVVKGIT